MKKYNYEAAWAKRSAILEILTDMVREEAITINEVDEYNYLVRIIAESYAPIPPDYEEAARSVRGAIEFNLGLR